MNPLRTYFLHQEGGLPALYTAKGIVTFCCIALIFSSTALYWHELFLLALVLNCFVLFRLVRLFSLLNAERKRQLLESLDRCILEELSDFSSERARLYLASANNESDRNTLLDTLDDLLEELDPELDASNRRFIAKYALLDLIGVTNEKRDERYTPEQVKLGIDAAHNFFIDARDDEVLRESLLRYGVSWMIGCVVYDLAKGAVPLSQPLSSGVLDDLYACQERLAFINVLSGVADAISPEYQQGIMQIRAWAQLLAYDGQEARDVLHDAEGDNDARQIALLKAYSLLMMREYGEALKRFDEAEELPTPDYHLKWWPRAPVQLSLRPKDYIVSLLSR